MVSNPYVGWRYDLGPSIFDRTHNFSANFIYSIPVLRNTSSHLLKSSLGGWQVSGIITIESGIPLNLTAGGGNQVGGGNRDEPGTASLTECRRRSTRSAIRHWCSSRVLLSLRLLRCGSSWKEPIRPAPTRTAWHWR